MVQNALKRLPRSGVVLRSRPLAADESGFWLELLRGISQLGVVKFEPHSLLELIRLEDEAYDLVAITVASKKTARGDHGPQSESRIPNDKHLQCRRSNFELRNSRPFIVNAVDNEGVKDMLRPDRRFSFGLPRTDIANYLGVPLLDSTISAKGRAGFVMADTTTIGHPCEMEFTEDLRKHAAEQGVAKKVMLKKGMEASSTKSVTTGGGDILQEHIAFARTHMSAAT